MIFRSLLQRSFIALFFLALISGCSTVGALMNKNFQAPQASVSNVSISGLSFDAANLLFDINVNNPNSVGIKLSGFDYDLAINGNGFLNGINSDGLEIAAGAAKNVQIPLSISFADLYRTFQSVQTQDSSEFALKAGLSFNVPILGDVRVPVSKSGFLPNVKLPKISVGALKVSSMNLTGADLELTVNMENPNAFGLNMDKMQYLFQVNGKKWGAGETLKNVVVGKNGSGSMTIPLKLNFLEMGTTVYQLLRSNGAVNYQLSGNMDLGSTLKLLPKKSINFDKSGDVNIQR
ncbi:MAG: LEA type 2 family protein [Calditrichia bacterium]